MGSQDRLRLYTGREVSKLSAELPARYMFSTSPKKKKKKQKQEGQCFGMSIKNGARKSLFQFLEALSPFGEDSPEGEELRAFAFAELNPDSEGNATFGGFEDFILQTLREKFPATAKEIHDAFRPCFRFGFDKASAWKYRRRGEATLNDNSEALVSSDSFRVLVAWTCCFAAMYDAFFILVKDPDPNARLGVDEWTGNSIKVMSHNFKGFEMLGDLKKNKMGLAAFFFTQVRR